MVAKRTFIVIFIAPIFLAGCQTVPQQQETVEVVETTVYVERPTTDSKVIVVKEQKSAGSPNKQKTLSVLTVTDNKGCPTRDPSSYGVFLKSERVENGILCYYD